MTNGDARSAHPRVAGTQRTTRITSSTARRAVPTRGATSSPSAVHATTGFISQELPGPGDLSSEHSWLWRRLAHVFGQHDLVPYTWYDPVNEQWVWAPFARCMICHRDFPR